MPTIKCPSCGSTNIDLNGVFELQCMDCMTEIDLTPPKGTLF